MSRHYVEISKGALFQMIMSGLESYTVQHAGNKAVGLEAFAHLWGTYTKTETTHRFLIDDISVDTSAKMRRESVTPNPQALQLKQAVSTQFGKGFQYLGDFHTHPWRRDEPLIPEEKSSPKVERPADIRKGFDESGNQPLYLFTDTDKTSSATNKPVDGTHFTIALVMTMFEMAKVDIERDGRIDDNTLEFSVGNIKCWLHAQVYDLYTPEDEFEDDLPTEVRTILKCNHLEEFKNIGWNHRLKTVPEAPELMTINDE